MKRYMTLDDLYNFYFSQGKNQVFSSNNNDETIVVVANGRMNFSKSDALDGLYPTRIQMNFVGDNLNNSRIEMKAQEAALPSSKYRPLLALIHDVDGEPQFYGHNMHQDEDGEIVYDEQPVGVIAEEAHIEHDDEYDMDYAVASGYIWAEYNKAAYILERDQKCDVSVELSIRSLSYNAKDQILVLDDFYYSGCTILGVNENGDKVNPAMPGSNITLADFSHKDTVTNFDHNEKLIEMLERLNNTLSGLNITKEESKEGGQNQVNKFEMLLEQYEKTVEDVTFEYEGLSDEELEVAFAEAFEESKKKKVEDDDANVVPENETPDVDDPKEPVKETENPTTEPTENETPENNVPSEPEENDNPETSDNEGETSLNSLQCSVTIGEKTKNFSVSMNAKIEALSQLVNDTYADDMTWYCIEAFDDPKQVVMIDCWTGRAYRQDYKVKDDVFSLKGDRVSVHSMWVTDDEQKAFEKMKADFAEIQTKFEESNEKLTKYEAEPEKMNILESEEYSSISDKEEFAELKKQENHFDMSIDELKKAADEIILSYAKKGSLTFSTENKENHSVGIKTLLNSKVNTKRSRYGGLGKKEN